MKSQAKTASRTQRAAKEPIAAVLLLSDRRLVGQLLAAYDRASSATVSSRTGRPEGLDEEIFYPTLYNH